MGRAEGGGQPVSRDAAKGDRSPVETLLRDFEMLRGAPRLPERFRGRALKVFNRYADISALDAGLADASPAGGQRTVTQGPGVLVDFAAGSDAAATATLAPVPTASGGCLTPTTWAGVGNLSGNYGVASPLRYSYAGFVDCVASPAAGAGGLIWIIFKVVLILFNMPRYPTPDVIYDAKNTTFDVLDEVLAVFERGAAGVVLHVVFTEDDRPVVTGRPLLRLGRGLRSVRSLSASEANGVYPLEKMVSFLSGVGEIYLETADPERLVAYVKPSWDVYVITDTPPPEDGPRWVYRVTRPVDVVKAPHARAVYFDISNGFPTARHVKYALSRKMKIMIGPVTSPLEVKQALSLGITRVVTLSRELIVKKTETRQKH